jgi:hypothetical protein
MARTLITSNRLLSYLKNGRSRQLPGDRIDGNEGYADTAANLKNL